MFVEFKLTGSGNERRVLVRVSEITTVTEGNHKESCFVYTKDRKLPWDVAHNYTEARGLIHCSDGAAGGAFETS